MKKFSWKLTAALAVSLSILLSSTVFPVNLRADGEEDGYPVIEEVEQIDEETEEQEEEEEKEEEDVEEDENVEQDENVEEDEEDVEENVENENDVDVEDEDLETDVTEDEKNAEIEDVDQPRLGADEEPMYEGEIGDEEPEDGYPLFICGSIVTDDNKDDLSSIEGVTVADGGSIKYDPDSNTLYLNKVTISHTTAEKYGIPVAIWYYGSADLKICVEGDTSVSSDIPDSYMTGGIFIGQPNSYYYGYGPARLQAAEDNEPKFAGLTVDISNDATLTISTKGESAYYYYYDYGSCSLYTQGSATITGKGAFVITSNSTSINCGYLTIENEGPSSITTDEGGAIYVNRDLMISNAKLTIEAGDGGIYVNRDVIISNAKLTIEAGDDGIFADGTITFTGKKTEVVITAEDTAVYAYDDYARHQYGEGYTNKTPEEVIKIEAPLYIVTPENGAVCHNNINLEDYDPDYYIFDPSIELEGGRHNFDDAALKVVIKADLVKVDFETNGGSEIESQDLAVGETVEKPADPTKSGYEFVGWFSDSECTKEFDFSTKVEKDMTLYAKWEECGKYVVVAGPSGSRAIGDGDMTIIVKHTKHDEQTHEKLKGVKFNGKPVDVKSVKKGSAIITIDGSLLDSLESGDYTITIEFEDGEASTFVSILNAAQSAAEDTAPTGVPKTGDTSSSSNLGLVFLAVAAIAGALIILENKKMREQD